MKKVTFNSRVVLENAKSGVYTKKELDKQIRIALRFGFQDVVNELSLYKVHAKQFTNDAVPLEIKERVAMGMSMLKNEGNSLARTQQMLNRHGLIETINRVSLHSAPDSKNFNLLRQLGRVDLTAEAIVLDFPDFFDAKVVAKAYERMYLQEAA